MRRQYSVSSLVSMAAFVALTASPAYAAGSGMPWETPLQAIVDSITGPVAQAAAVIAVTIFGLGLAFSESGSGMRRGLSILFGLAIAFAAASFFLDWFGFAGGITLPAAPVVS